MIKRTIELPYPTYDVITMYPLTVYLNIQFLFASVYAFTLRTMLPILTPRVGCALVHRFRTGLKLLVKRGDEFASIFECFLSKYISSHRVPLS